MKTNKKARRAMSALKSAAAPVALLAGAALQPQIAYAQDQDGFSRDVVVVTGERAPRTLQETASSVAVVTGDDINAFAGIDNVTDVLRLIPNVTFTGANNNGPTIRGSDTSGVLTDAEGAFGGARPRSTIQIDGRPLTFNEYVFASSSVWDVNRVEVFRGPQSTTQGRNAISGAIFIETKRPKLRV